MALHYRLELEYKHVNPNYVVYKIAKNVCEYCRHIKILKDHSQNRQKVRKFGHGVHFF